MAAFALLSYFSQENMQAYYENVYNENVYFYKCCALDVISSKVKGHVDNRKTMGGFVSNSQEVQHRIYHLLTVFEIVDIKSVRFYTSNAQTNSTFGLAETIFDFHAATTNLVNNDIRLRPAERSTQHGEFSRLVQSNV